MNEQPTPQPTTEETIAALAAAAQAYVALTGRSITDVICVRGHRRVAGAKCKTCHQETVRRSRARKKETTS